VVVVEVLNIQVCLVALEEIVLEVLAEHQLLLVVAVVVEVTLAELHLDLVDLHLVLIQINLDMLVVVDLRKVVMDLPF
jgi:hypothetical protein